MLMMWPLNPDLDKSRFLKFQSGSRRWETLGEIRRRERRLIDGSRVSFDGKRVAAQGVCLDRIGTESRGGEGERDGDAPIERPYIWADDAILPLPSILPLWRGVMRPGSKE